MGVFDSSKKKQKNERSEELKPQGFSANVKVNTDEYHIGEWIGETPFLVRDIKKGGMGVVYVVWNEITKETFAFETFRNEYFTDQDTRDRFVKEAALWVNLEKHTNIIQAKWVENFRGKPHVFMEYVNGGDLSQYIGKLAIAYIVDFSIQICTGMDYAYRKHAIIHRDIKPRNLLVTSDRVVKISDFGLAAIITRKPENVSGEYGNILSRGMGTWPYMPPEQFPEQVQNHFHFSQHPVTTYFDIFSSGVTIYELLTSSLPFSNVEDIFNKTAVNPRALNPSIPDSVASLVLKCLEKNPDNRFKSFEQLREALIEVYNTLPDKDRTLGDKYVVKGTAQPLTTEEWSNKGASFDNLSQYEIAINCFNMALNMDPNNRAAWNNKGSSLAKLGRNSEAIECFNKAIEGKGWYTQAWLNKALALERLGMKKEATYCREMALH